MYQTLNQRPYLHAENLVLELTRRCNFACTHCLRGETENTDMTEEIIDKVMDNFDGFTEVTFTGGEPTLNLDAMEYFFKMAKIRNKSIDCFYVATNGHENQERLANILLNAYMDCESQDLCGVSLSMDDFHDGFQSEYVKGLAFYQPVKEHHTDDPHTWIIQTGRAEDFRIGRPPKYFTDFHATRTTPPDNSIYVETAYVSTNGFLYPDCDLSYEIMDKNKKLQITQARPYFFELTKPGKQHRKETFLEI